MNPQKEEMKTIEKTEIVIQRWGAYTKTWTDTLFRLETERAAIDWVKKECDHFEDRYRVVRRVTTGEEIFQMDTRNTATHGVANDPS